MYSGGVFFLFADKGFQLIIFSVSLWILKFYNSERKIRMCDIIAIEKGVYLNFNEKSKMTKSTTSTKSLEQTVL